MYRRKKIILRTKLLYEYDPQLFSYLRINLKY